MGNFSKIVAILALLFGYGLIIIGIFQEETYLIVLGAFFVINAKLNNLEDKL